MPSFGFLSDLDLLLFGRLQLAIGLSLGAQALDRIHHVGLLRQHRIAEFLGPIGATIGTRRGFAVILLALLCSTDRQS